LKLSDLGDRFVITGSGIICAIGNNNAEVWQNLNNSEQLMGTEALGENKKTISRPLDVDFAGHMSVDMCRMATKLTKMALIAAKEAALQADIAGLDKNKTGAIVGTALSGTVFREEICNSLQEGKKRASALLASRCAPNESVGALCLELGIKGHNTVVSSFATSSLNALFNACVALACDDMKAMVAVGAEEISGIVMELCKTAIIGDQSSISRRSIILPGISPAEGAAAIVVEREQDALQRGAVVLGRIDEIAITQSRSDPRHIVDSLERSMRACLAWKPNSFYISANANGSVLDRLENMAMKRVFGLDIPRVARFKYAAGETFGASGMMQVVTAVNSLRHDSLPTTMDSGSGKTERVSSITGRDGSGSGVLINCFDQYGTAGSALLCMRGQ